MAKNKNKEYTPLFWCKTMKSQLSQSVGNMSAEEIYDFVYGRNATRTMEIIRKYPMLDKLISLSGSAAYVEGSPYGNGREALKEFISDLDAIYNIEMWSRNKQVYKFDKDFMHELIRTDNCVMVKDMFDYLPFNFFYIDLSDDEELVEQILCEGMFIYVDKVTNDEIELYKIHLCKVKDKVFFNDTFTVSNIDGERPRMYNGEFIEVPIIESPSLKSQSFTKKNVSYDASAYESLVFQMLSYLSSIEPDITDSITTKNTYRKPNPNYAPKNKFSEVKVNDVGIKYGSAFRKWKNESQIAKESTGERTGTGAGTKKRPHARKAHWSHYWYGKRDSEERIRRPKWIESTLVGTQSKDSPAIIHKVKKEKDVER